MVAILQTHIHFLLNPAPHGKNQMTSPTASHDDAAARRKSLLIGLGGGALASYIQTGMPVVDLTIVELDPVMVDVASTYFGFQPESERMHVIVGDGLNVLKSTGTLFVDVDNVSLNIYMI
jgi:spermidine synthase